MAKRSLDCFISARLVLVASCLALLLASPASLALAQDDATGAPTAQEEFKQLAEEAQKNYDDGEYAEAAAIYGQLIARSGGYSPEPYFKRAQANVKLEEYAAAIEDLRETLTYASGNKALIAETKNLRGEVYLEQGNIQLALPDLQAAVSENRNNPRYQFNLGKALAKGGAAREAEKTLTRYLEMEDPDLEERESETYLLRGQSYAALQRYDQARADLAKAQELDPEAHEAFFLDAQIAMFEKDYEAAADAFEKAIQNYTPEDESDDLPYIQAHLTRAVALEEVGKEAEDADVKKKAFEGQKAESERLLDALPDRAELGGIKAAALFRLGVAERFLGNFPEAVKAFSEALEINPSMGEGFFRRGICFFYMGEEQLAILDFESAAALDFASPRANLWKGRTYAQLGDHREAIKAYGEALGVSDRYADAYINRGLSYVQLGDYDKAVDDFNEAIRLNPGFGKPYYYRGVAYRMQGERTKALKSLTNAVQFDPELAPAYRSLGNMLSGSGRSGLAGEYLRKAQELEAASR